MVSTQRPPDRYYPIKVGSGNGVHIGVSQFNGPYLPECNPGWQYPGYVTMVPSSITCKRCRQYPHYVELAEQAAGLVAAS